MNQGKIWLVVKPTVGLPALLGTVLVIAILVHWAVLEHTTWVARYWNGAARAPTVSAPVAMHAAPAVTAAPSAMALPSGTVYFDVDRADHWAEGGASIEAVVAYLKDHDQAGVAISGYHDPSGDPAHNLELAKHRAVAVRDALVAAGVGSDRIVLDKPTQTTGSADVAREGRRVEVTIRP